MDIRISVIVSVHNDEINLKAALDSIKAQKFKSFEVLMIDAASTDSSAEIMKSYCGDKRFIYHYMDVYSFSAARNYAISIARGKYVAFGDASVVFTADFLSDMYNCCERENADMCVAPMASSDIFGKHIFTSSGILSRRKRTNKFDTDLIWNPAVTNKLFRRDKIISMGLEFKSFGKAREAAFSLSFAFESSTIVCSSKGAASYIIPVYNSGVAEFPIDHYLSAYDYILEKAFAAFSKAISECETQFEQEELKKLSVYYIDEVLRKEITVLLYSYYRHFWTIDDEQIIKFVAIIDSLLSRLSPSGKKNVLSKNKDIFFDGRLIDSKHEMAHNPRVTVCIGKNEKKGHLHERRLEIQLHSLFAQTMPCFELLVDHRLKDIFPEKYLQYENVKFVRADSLGEFKDNALEMAKTKYIMFQDGYARLNPKLLMRHYVALEGREKYGFTTSPLTKFDGKITEQYTFSELFFYSDMSQSRISIADGASAPLFALDLFFTNKLFRVDHLNGIHFTFSDNPVDDMYKLYRHSRFKKLSHRGAYLPYTEEQAISALLSQQDKLPGECKRLYKSYKRVYHSLIIVKKRKAAFIGFLKRVKRLALSVISRLLVLIFSHLKIKKRVFFYTIRKNGALDENSEIVYNALDCRKTVFAHMLPHSALWRCRAKYYLLTSKVVVTDDYLKYLREVKLRPSQRVVQLWHAGGAFKRFGLDAPSRLTRIEEYSTHSQYSCVCVSSEYVRQFYAHAFGINIERVRALGMPRTDKLVSESYRQQQRERLISHHPLLKDKRVYVYMPTFRETDGAPADFDPRIDWARLNDELSDDEVFIISRHPVMKRELIKGMFLSRVKDYTFESTSALLCVADVVVTDYSSVIFDASLTGAAMVFYCPDYHSYERDFYLDFQTQLPGRLVTESSELLPALREATCSDNAEEFRQMQMGACDGKSTQRITKLIEDYLEG